MSVVFLCLMRPKLYSCSFCTIHLLNLALHELTEGTSIAVTSMAVNVTVNGVSRLLRETRVYAMASSSPHHPTMFFKKLSTSLSPPPHQI